MLRIVYEERGLTLRDRAFSDARNMLEIQKLFKKPDYYLDMIAMPLHEKYLNASGKDEIIFYGYLYQEKKFYIFSQNEDIRLKWQKRLDNLAELKQSIHEYETTCGEEATAAHYLAHVALFTNSDAEDGSDKVKLMTVHAAKGLEFPYVFLCGMNEGVFPSRKTKDLPGMEEERRLAFVAITRAEKRLFLSGAEGWNFDGSPRYPSRFVLDIDGDLMEYARKPSDTLVKDAREHIAYSNKYMPENLESSLFSAGDRVRHKYLGEGRIRLPNYRKKSLH